MRTEMFPFSCLEAKLVNLLMDQNAPMGDVLFPQSKGWQLELSLFRPKGSELCLVVVQALSKEEQILFVPLSQDAENRLVWCKKGRFKEAGLIRRKKFQAVVITSQEKAEKLEELLDEWGDPENLLSLSANQLEFVTGGFENSRLEFRLQGLEFNAELISDRVPPNLLQQDQPQAKARVMQDILHRLSLSWVREDQKLDFNQLLEESLFFWPLYHKLERRQLACQIKEELNRLLKEYLSEFAQFAAQQKKMGSQPQWVVRFSPGGQDRKLQALWAKKLNAALAWFGEMQQQLEIEPEHEQLTLPMEST